MDRQDRRLRVPFTAAAEIAPETSPAAGIPANVTELSLYGCYIATPAPFPEQTLLRVKIFGEGEYFEARATVVYSQPAKGMGVAFREINPVFLATLKRWILEAMNSRKQT